MCGNRIGGSPMPADDPVSKSISVIKRAESRNKAMVFTTVKILALILLLISFLVPQISVYESHPTFSDCFDAVLHDFDDITYPPVGIKLSAFVFSILLGVATLIENKPASIIFSGLGLYFQVSIMYGYVDNYADSFLSFFGVGDVTIYGVAEIGLFLWAFIASCCITSNEFSKEEIRNMAKKAESKKEETKI